MTPTSSRRRTAPRRLLGAVASLVTLAALAACSTAGTDDSASPAPAGGGDIATTTLAEADAFPVSIDHAYGSTTIEEEPQRVVTIGWSSQDAVVAFGKVPVGIEKFSGPGIEDDILPWLTDTFEGATPAQADGSLQFPEQCLHFDVRPFGAHRVVGGFGGIDLDL